jgi:hypothetical protein
MGIQPPTIQGTTAGAIMLITDTDYQSLVEQSDIAETVSLSAIPTIPNVFYNTSGGLVEITSDFTLNKTITSYNSYVLYGTNFSRTDAVLLSSSTNSSLTTSFSSISSKYTGATSGYALTPSQYSILSDKENEVINLEEKELNNSDTSNKKIIL